MYAADSYTIRVATDRDAEALRRLAALDSKAPLEGTVLVGEIAGRRPLRCRWATTARSPTRSFPRPICSPRCACARRRCARWIGRRRCASGSSPGCRPPTASARAPEPRSRVLHRAGRGRLARRVRRG